MSVKVVENNYNLAAKVPTNYFTDEVQCGWKINDHFPTRFSFVVRGGPRSDEGEERRTQI